MERLTPTPTETKSKEDIDALDVSLDSPALDRLLNEVRDEGLQVTRNYNRTYNRHNR